MKILMAIILFAPIFCFGQVELFVSSNSGLNVRNTPSIDSKIKAKILFGQKLKILSKSGKKLTVNDTDKETGQIKKIEGEWVKIEYSKTFFTEPNEGQIYENPLKEKVYTGYVFDGFLKEASFPEFIKVNYVNLDSLEQKYERDYYCYKYKDGVPFSGVVYDVFFSNELFRIDPIYGNGYPKYIDGPSINIYIAEFTNGILTGKIKKINPLTGIEKEVVKIIDLDKIDAEKEIIIKYAKVEFEMGDLSENVFVEGAVFYDANGNTVKDFTPFNFWKSNNEEFLNKGNENKFIKITYSLKYIKPKGDFGYEYSLKPTHFFDLDCNLYDVVTKAEIIEDFKIQQ